MSSQPEIPTAVSSLHSESLKRILNSSRARSQAREAREATDVSSVRRRRTRSLIHFDDHCTFRPRISSASRRIATDRTQEYWEARKQSNRERILKEAHAEEVFRPKLNRHSTALITTTFFERQQQYLTRRAQLNAVAEAYRIEEARVMQRKSPPVRIAPLPARSQSNTPTAKSTSATTATTLLAQSTTLKSSSSTSLTTTGNERPSTRRSSSAGVDPQSKARFPSAGMAQKSTARNKTNLQDSNAEGTENPCRNSTSPTKHREGKLPLTPAQASPHKKPTKVKNLPVIDQDRLRELKAAREARAEALTAVKHNKVFAMYGRYPDLRHALQQRGWVEKIPPREETMNAGDDCSGLRIRSEAEILAKKEKKLKKAQKKAQTKSTHQDSDNDADDDDADDDDDGDNADGPLANEDSPGETPLVSRALGEFPANLIWTCHRADVDFRSLKPQQTVNHFRANGNITTKFGLASVLANARFTAGADEHAFYPRCYYISSEEQFMAFVEDYRLKAAVAVIKRRNDWNPPAQLLKFALQHCRNHLKRAEHDDLDEVLEEASDIEFETLLQFVYQKLGIADAHRQNIDEDPEQQEESSSDSETEEPVAQRRELPRSKQTASAIARQALEKLVARFTNPDMLDQARSALQAILANVEAVTDAMQQESVQVLEGLAVIDPQLEPSGFRNVWVIKPAAKSRGRGIFCENRLDFILPVVTDGSLREQWVAQKYIENPLLIHRTKFDIRQWVVVTSWNPLTIWMFQHCYLRFSSVPFTLQDLHSDESKHVHLCNNSIQKTAMTTPTSSFATGCMWTSSEFQKYLADQGQPTLWDSTISPQMKQIAIVALSAAQQENVEGRKNSFELFGFDFMIDDNYNVWLLEINSSPDLSHSTDVTAQLVEIMFEDLMKVILDRRTNKKCDTGLFECIFKGPVAEGGSLGAARDLAVDGTPLMQKRAPNYNHFSRRSMGRRDSLSTTARSRPATASATTREPTGAHLSIADLNLTVG
eukprot:m.82550 g.82550  ORF g.82550 m.82550 type:complete len:994 (+) comp14302_c1_seq2:358-3339(+)